MLLSIALVWYRPIQAKQVTVKSILDDLARALASAECDKDWKGMVSAAIGQARVSGLMVDRHLVKAQHSTLSTSPK